MSRRRRRLLTAVVALLGSTAIGIGGYLIRTELRARGHENEAQAAIDRRDFKLALSHLERCREAWPNNGEIAFLTARTARRAGDFKAAERHLNDAERLGWVAQAVFLERALLRAQQGGFPADEGYLLTCVLEDHPESPLILEVIAPIYVNGFDVPKATALLEIWVRRAPNHSRPHILKGDLAKRLNRKTDALAFYREAYRLAPEDPEVRERLGGMLVDTKSFQEAIAHLSWLIERGGADPDVHLNLARCRAALGDEAEARQMLDRLAREYPDNTGVLAERGLLELDGGQPGQAEAWFRKAAERQPFDPVICHNYARCLEQLAKPDEARKYRERARQIEAALTRMAQLMRAIAASPRDPELRREAGAIMLRNGQEKAGLSWFETALKQDPNHGPTHEALADHYLRVGDQSRADFHRRKAPDKPQGADGKSGQRGMP